MRGTRGLSASALVVLGLLSTAPTHADWPQFRGPERAGRAQAPEGGIHWPPREVWRRPIGSGFSGIAVTEHDLYTLFAEDGKEFLGRFDARDGQELWRLELGPVFEETWGDGPRATPTSSGDRVVALGGHGRLAVAHAESGAQIWSRELGAREGLEPPFFGWSVSPLVDDGRVVLETGGADGLVTAFALQDGEVLWEALEGQPGYSSPLRMVHGDAVSYILQTRREIAALSPEGKVRWSWPLTGGSAIDLPIAMPVDLGEGRIFSAHRAEGGSVALEVSATAGERKELWESRFMLSHLSSPVRIRGELYGFHNATLRCLSAATGEPCWSKRGLGKGSLIAVGETLVVLADDGRLLRVEATPEAYRERGELRVLTGKSWTAPSVSDGRLYLRNGTEMVCLDLRRGDRR